MASPSADFAPPSRVKPVTGAEVADAMSDVLLTDDFFDKHWEKLPLHLKRSDQKPGFGNLLPEAIKPDDFMAILRRSSTSLKMFRKGEPYSSENFVLAYLEGASLVINQTDRLHPVLYDMCRKLAEKHFLHVFSVCYLTPAHSHAVRLHNDDQDVFLLQVWGTKEWTVRNAPKELIYTEEMLGKGKDVPPELIGEPTMEFTMEPGDMLYIPRGFLHEAKTGTDPSLHVTITMPTSDYCWGVQLVKHLWSEMNVETGDASREMASRSLSSGHSVDKGATDADLDKQLSDIMQNWKSNVSVDDVVKGFEQRMARTNDGQAKGFQEAMNMPMRPRFKEDSRVRLMHGVSCTVDSDDDVVVFERSGRALEMPVAPTVKELLRSLTNKVQFVRNLPCADPMERLCILEVLLHYDVVQLFVESESTSSASPIAKGVTRRADRDCEAMPVR